MPFITYVGSFLAVAVAAYSGLSETVADLFATSFVGVGDPSSVVRLAAPRLNTPFPVSSLIFSKPELDVVRAVLTPKIPALEGYGTLELALTNTGVFRTIRAYAVSRGFFGALQSAPASGSLAFRPDESSGVVVTETFCRSLGKNSNEIIGNVIHLNGTPWTVQGVVRQFDGLDGSTVDAFIPLEGVSRLNVGTQWLGDQTKWIKIIVRLSSIATSIQIQRDAAALLKMEPVEFDAQRLSFENLNLALAPERSHRGTILLLAQGTSLALLVIVMTNFAQLMTVRRLFRIHEFAVHDALGAGPLRLAALASAEAVLILFLGITGGFALARMIASLAAQSLDVTQRVVISRPNSAAILGLLALVAIATVAPVVVTAAKGRTFASLRAGRDGSPHSRRALDVMLAIQILIATVTIVLTAVAADNLVRVTRVKYGFDPDHLYAIKPTLGLAHLDYSRLQQIAARLRESPGISGASVVGAVPTQSFAVTRLFLRSGSTSLADLDVEVHYVDSAFFSIAGVPLRQDERGVNAPFGSGSNVVIMSESVAAAYRMALRRGPVCAAVGGPDAPCRTMIGVTGETNYRGLMSDDQPAVYVPIDSTNSRQAAILIRSTLPPARAMMTLAQSLRSFQDDRSPMQVLWIRGNLDAQSAPWRTGIGLMLLFCSISVVIAAVGVASIGLRTIQVRRRDIGVALALGAPPQAVVRRFLGRAAAISTAAAASALVLTILLARHYGPMLLLGSRVSYLTAFAVALTLTTASVCVGFVAPVRRLRRIQPVEVLKEGV